MRLFEKVELLNSYMFQQRVALATSIVGAEQSSTVDPPGFSWEIGLEVVNHADAAAAAEDTETGDEALLDIIREVVEYSEV